MILRSNSLEVLWHTFEVYFLFSHEKCFKSVCKIGKVFIRTTCLSLSSAVSVFSHINIILGHCFWIWSHIDFHWRDYSSRSNTVHTCGSARSCLQHAFYEQIAASTCFIHQNRHFVFWNWGWIKQNPDLLSCRSKKLHCILKVPLILSQCSK